MKLTTPPITTAQSTEPTETNFQFFSSALDTVTVPSALCPLLHSRGEERRARAQGAEKQLHGKLRYGRGLLYGSLSKPCKRIVQLFLSINPVLLYIYLIYACDTQAVKPDVLVRAYVSFVTVLNSDEKMKAIVAFFRSFSKQAPIISRCVSTNFQPNATSLNKIQRVCSS